MSTTKLVLGVGFGSFLQLMGGLLIGLGIGLLIISPYLVRFNENMTSEINQILATWRSRHPDDPVPQGWAITPPEVYQAAMNLTNLSWGLIVIGVCLCIGGELTLYYGYKSKLKEAPKEEKLFCRYCGSENKKDAAYCYKCGKPMK